MPSPSLRQRLHDGPLNGCFLQMTDTVVAETIAASGFDAVMIDLEHGPGSYTDALKTLQALRAGSVRQSSECAGLVRAPSAADADIKKTLDIGPAGVMAPMVNSGELAERVVRSCHYAPRGIRSCAAPVVRATTWGEHLDDYDRFMDEDFVVICQVEHVDAVNAIEDIAAVEGLHLLFVGPFDLSASLGDLGNFQAPAFREALATIEDAAARHGKLLGNLILPELPASELVERGYRLLFSAADIALLRQGAVDKVAEIRAQLT